MAAKAASYSEARAIKIKLGGNADDESRIATVRAARPDVWLAVDANRSLTPTSLLSLLPALEAAAVKLIEQPFAVGDDAALAGLDLPIPVAADESIQTADDRSEEQTSELQSLMRISYAVFCLKKKKK